MSKIITTVSKPVGSVNEQLDTHHKVNLPVSPGAKKIYLKIADSQHGMLRIPLGTTQSYKNGEHPTEQNVFIPVVPLRFTTPDCNPEQATIMREGYLYVYKDNKIWRELKLSASGYMSDISLEHNEGKDCRKATGIPDNRLILPYYVGGEKQDIKITYSEVQWSWARIKKVEEDSDLRNRRLQGISFQKYAEGFPTLEATQLFARIEEISLAPAKLPEITLLRSQKIPVIYLHDPLGVADILGAKYQSDLQDLTAKLEEMTTLEHLKDHPDLAHLFPKGREDSKADERLALHRMATMSYHAFFNKALWATEEVDRYSAKNGIKYQQTQYANNSNNAKDFRDQGEELDQNFIKELLAVDERRLLRQKIRRSKQIFAAYLNDEREVESAKYQRIKPETQDFIHLSEALLDYATQEGLAYIQLFDRACTLFAFLNFETTIFDGGYDLNADVTKERQANNPDLGKEYLTKIFQDTSSPLHRALFPGAEQIDLENGIINVETKLEPSNGEDTCRAGSLLTITQHSKKPAWGIDKTVLAMVEQSQEIISGILSIFQSQWQEALKQQQEIQLDPLFRLGTCALPKGAKIINPGAEDDGFIILDGKEETFKALKRAGKRTATAKAGKTDTPHAKVIHPETGKVIGSQDISELNQYAGVADNASEADYDSLWQRPKETLGGKSAYEATGRYIAISEEYATTIAYNLSKAAQETPFGKNFVNNFPHIIIVFELMNITTMLQTLEKDDPNKSLNMANLNLAINSLVHATVGVAARLSKDDVVMQWIGERIDKKRSVSLTMRIDPRILGHYTFKLGGAALAGIGAGMAAWTTIDSLMRGDEDAAIGHAITTVGASGLAVAALMTAELITPITFVTGPLAGGVFLALIFLGACLAYTLQESDLEKWAEDGPLTKRNHNRMINEFEGQTMAYALGFLTCQLTPPSLTVKRDKARSGTDDYIEVTFTAPGFITGQSVMDIQATCAKREEGVIYDSWQKQQRQYPQIIEPLFSEDGIRQIGTRYLYLDEPAHTKWQIRARHINKDQQILPPRKETDPAYDPIIIDDEKKGWVYGELITNKPTDDWQMPISA